MPSRSEQTLAALQDFLTTPLAERLGHIEQAEIEQRLLALFRAAAEQVPAYRTFLQSQGIAPGEVKTLADYGTLPLMNKQNYMRAYPLAQRCRDGDLSGCDMLAVSSGSTGTPMAWPRTAAQELDIAYRFEQVFHAFRAKERSTLAVVCFAMGMWVGGMFTAACCRHLAAKGYPITVVTPGNKKEEIFRVVQELGPDYDQVALLGYPPFIKDVIDGGRAEGIDWALYKPKLVFAGEVFSEEWRGLVCERIGSAQPANDTASLYGTADGGVLGNETPLSITIRKFFAARPELAREVFGESRLPTLVQYDPLSRWFEVHDGTLVVSGDNGVPLLRYHIADKGGIIAYDEMMRIVTDAGFPADQFPPHSFPLSPRGERSEGGVAVGVRGSPGTEHPECPDNASTEYRDAWPLPFVYLFGRADFTVSYFGANVYPENISVGLEQTQVREWVSGKFVLQVVETDDRNEALSITVELLPAISGDEAKGNAIADAVLQQLKRLNSEFSNYVPAEYQRPRINLKPNGDPEWFPVGVKHRYTRKGYRSE